MRLTQLAFVIGPAALALAAISGLAPPDISRGPRFSVTYRGASGATPLDGRLLLILSTDPAAEPRLQISESITKTQQIFGVDVEGWKAGEPALVEGGVLGYPVESLAAIPPGTYQVQALLHRYETFHRADGHVVKLPMDRGEGQQWSKAPGNLYSTPRAITIEAGKPATVRDRARPGDPADPGSADDEVRQAREDPERAALEVLGPADVPRRARPPARGLRRAPGRALPARDLPRAFPVHDRRLPREAARSEPEARLLRALPPRRLQPHRAGARLPVLQGLDRPELPALHRRRDPAREPVLRRLLRGELGKTSAPTATRSPTS